LLYDVCPGDAIDDNGVAVVIEQNPCWVIPSESMFLMVTVSDLLD